MSKLFHARSLAYLYLAFKITPNLARSLQINGYEVYQ